MYIKWLCKHLCLNPEQTFTNASSHWATTEWHQTHIWKSINLLRKHLLVFEVTVVIYNSTSVWANNLTYVKSLHKCLHSHQVTEQVSIFPSGHWENFYLHRVTEQTLLFPSNLWANICKFYKSLSNHMQVHQVTEQIPTFRSSHWESIFFSLSLLKNKYPGA